MKFKEVKLTSITINVAIEQAEYLRSLNNYNSYLCWMISQDEGFQKFMKEKK